MRRLPVLSGGELIKVLARAGFEPKRRKGSHVVLVKETGKGGKILVVVPDHREIDRGTLLEILRQSGLNREELLNLLRS